MEGNKSDVSPTILPDNQLCLVSANTSSLLILIILLALSLVILVILSFTQRRKKLCHGCLWGFPGLPVPMDFLITPRYRFVYILVFGVMATSVVSVFTSISSPDGLNFYVGIIYRILVSPLLVVLILSLQFFPLFSCVNASLPLLGHILGFIYSLLWFASKWPELLLKFTPYICDGVVAPLVIVMLNVAASLPIIIFSFVIVVWYAFKVIQGLLTLCGVLKKSGDHSQQFVCCGKECTLKSTDGPKSEVKSYYLLHVKSLLATPQEPAATHRGKLNMFFDKAIEYIIPYREDFRLPLPFVGAVFAMSMLLYQLTITAIITGATLANSLPPIFENTIEPIFSFLIDTANQLPANSTNVSTLVTVLSALSDSTGTLLVGLPAFFCISPFVSLVFSLCLLMNMVASVSKQLKRIAREGFTEALPSASTRVTSSWKYVGYLIGYFVLAWGIYTLVVFLVLTVVAFLYLGFKYLTEFTAQIILYIAVPVVWSAAILLLQGLICRFVFFEDQTGKFIALKNKRLFNWFAFILFFYNGIAGFVGAILRTILSSVFSLILLFRLDRTVLLKGFERFDTGHRAYLGFIYLVSIYNNAVMHVFVYLLMKEAKSNLVNNYDQSEPSSAAYSRMTDSKEYGLSPRPAASKSRQARNRWLVAYTLLRNPSLQELTASKLKAKSETSTISNSRQQDKADVQVKYEAPVTTLAFTPLNNEK